MRKWWIAKWLVVAPVFALAAIAGATCLLEVVRGPVASFVDWRSDTVHAIRRHEAAARTLAKPAEKEIDLGDGLTMRLVLIPPGDFEGGNWWGSYPGWFKVTKRFYMGIHEVTQEQYERVMGDNPSHFKDPKNPVETVSWHDAESFCRKLSSLTGMPMRLPTEAEWEHACRAGVKDRYLQPSVTSADQANYNGHYGAEGVYRRRTTPVGSFAPNAWGLYDMHGNVFEWCRDWYDADYYTDCVVTDPQGPPTGSGRILRGGSWLNSSLHCESDARNWLRPAEASWTLGFRVVLPAPSSTGEDGAEGTARGEAVTQQQGPEVGDGLECAGWPFDVAEARRRQKEAARALGVPVEEEIHLAGDVKIDLVLIPAGEFLMGSALSPEEVADRYHSSPGLHWYEHPQHRVRITQSFYMGMTEITQEQYGAVAGPRVNRSGLGDPKNPVEELPWRRAQRFCEKLSARTGRTVRLPTEAEWEYACRAGSAAAFCFGNNSSGLNDYAWWSGNAGPREVFRRTPRYWRTRDVAEKRPNAWRLYDMHGNVWEWCQDWYDADYYLNGPTDNTKDGVIGERSRWDTDYWRNSPTDDPAGPESGEYRVVRGGYWRFPSQYCRSAARYSARPTEPSLVVGFRVVVEVAH